MRIKNGLHDCPSFLGKVVILFCGTSHHVITGTVSSFHCKSGDQKGLLAMMRTKEKKYISLHCTWLQYTREVMFPVGYQSLS